MSLDGLVSMGMVAAIDHIGWGLNPAVPLASINWVKGFGATVLRGLCVTP